VQDLGGWQDDHAEKDIEDSQRGSGQDAPACRCPLEHELLLGRRRRVNCIGEAGAERLAGVLAQCASLAYLNLSPISLEQAGQIVLQECWGSAQRWLTSISATIWER